MKISEYFKELEKSNIAVHEKDNFHANILVIVHIKYLIAKGILVNQNRSMLLKDFGIYIGADNT